jgi:hypothetical protein
MTPRRMLTVLLLGVLWLWAGASPAVADGETCFLPGTDLSDWREIFRKDNIVVYAMPAPDNDIMAFRATGTLKAPIDQIMEVLRQVEIAGQWMPDIIEKNTIEEISDLEAVTYSINKLPWPFAGRELILNNALRLDAKNRFLVVDVYSVERSDILPRDGSVRAVMHCGQTRMRPAAGGRTEMDIILYVDPKGAIPAWLVNFAQRRMPYNFLRALEQKAATTHYPLRPAFRRLLDQLIALPDSDAPLAAPRAPAPRASAD